MGLAALLLCFRVKWMLTNDKLGHDPLEEMSTNLFSFVVFQTASYKMEVPNKKIRSKGVLSRFLKKFEEIIFCGPQHDRKPELRAHVVLNS